MLFTVSLATVANAFGTLPAQPVTYTQTNVAPGYPVASSAYMAAQGFAPAPEQYVVEFAEPAQQEPASQSALFAVLGCGVGDLLGYSFAKRSLGVQQADAVDLERALAKAVYTAPAPRVIVNATAPRPVAAPRPQRAPVRKSLRSNVAGLQMSFDQEAFIAESKEMRLKHLEEQAMFALKTSCENFENPVFPNAMIAGDCVITHLLGRLGYLESGKCKIMVVDTFHLFPETLPFLEKIEKEFNFKAEVFCAEGVPVPRTYADGDEAKAAYDAKYGADLWKEDIEQYDKICKVEPFQRGLKTLN